MRQSAMITRGPQTMDSRKMLWDRPNERHVQLEELSARERERERERERGREAA